MSDKKEIGIGDSGKFGVILEKKGLFNYYDFYKVFADFFKDYKYFYNEKEYSTKTKPQGKEVVMEFEGDRKVNDYLRFYIAIRVEIRSTKNLNIESHKKQQGHVTVRFRAYYETDYLNRLNKFFRYIYDNYLYKEKRLEYEGKLWAEANALIDNVKETLGLISRK